MPTDLCKEASANLFGNNGEGELWLVAALLLKAFKKLGYFKVIHMLNLSLPYPISVDKDAIREAVV